MSARRPGDAPRWVRGLVLSCAALALVSGAIGAQTYRLGERVAPQPRPSPSGVVSAAPLERRSSQNGQIVASSRVDGAREASAPGTLRGRGVLIGDWDDGHARDTHEDLRGRIVVRDAAGLSGHATHTTATAVGSGIALERARGIAPEARVWAFDWQLDAAELEAAAPVLAHSNHPYGLTMGWSSSPACPSLPTWWGGEGEREDARFGKYGPSASQMDGVVYRSGLPLFWPAGNERAGLGVAAAEPHFHAGACGVIERDTHLQESTLQYDTLGGAGVAKNVITVGAARTAPGSASGAQLWPVDISAFGPTDDGRIKPDLAVAGEQVFSAYAGSDTDHQAFDGTSSAVSGAAGIAALVTERHRELLDADLDAAAMRALLVYSTREAGHDPGPDYRLGYGLLDASLAISQLDLAASDPERRAILAAAVGGVAGDTLELTAVGVSKGEALRVVLAWSDPPAAPNVAGNDDARATLVHDLDLELIAPDGTRFFPWSLAPDDPMAEATADAPNRRDNLEVIDVPASENTRAGTWTVRVRAPAALQRAGVQPLALVSSVLLEPAGQALLSTRRNVEIAYAVGDSPEPVELTIANQGSAQLDWQASSDVAGLDLSPASGAGGERLRIELDPGAFTEVGEYPLRVLLTSNDPRGPAVVGVLVRVTCAPDCRGRTCGADPVCGELCGRCELGERCVMGSCEAARFSAGSCEDLDSALGSALVQDALGTRGGADLGGASAGTCGGQGAPELGFRWSAPRSGDYVITTSAALADTVLYVRAGDCAGAELACNDNAGQASSVALTLEAGERIGILVDTNAAPMRATDGEFDLNVRSARCPDVDLGARAGIGRVRASTYGGIDQARGSCGGQDTEDVAFAFTAPAAGRYAFRLFDPRFQAVLYVRAGDCDGAELGCSPAPDVGPVELTLDAGERVIVIVDGREGRTGDFELDILSTDALCGDACASPPAAGGSDPAAGACACDAACVARGDCCIDACERCGACRCQRQCAGMRCGDDGCGGRCGECGAGLACNAGRCQPDPCDGIACDACSQCIDGACQPLPEAAACEDGDLCTVLDVCTGGECAGIPRDCDDGLACTIDRCDEDTGRCIPEPTAECGRCDGGIDCPHSLRDPPDAGGDAAMPDGGDASDAGVGEGGVGDGAAGSAAAGDGGCGCRTLGGGATHDPRAPRGLLGVGLLFLAIRIGSRRKRG